MNILFVALTDPREISYGGQQRTHILWEALKTCGNVWTLIPVPQKSQEGWVEEEKIYKVCFEKRHSLGWFFQRLWSRFLPPATVHWGINFGLRPGRCFVEKLKEVKFDAVVSRTLGVAGRYRLWRIGPMYVDVDDTPTTDYRLARPGNRIRLWLLTLWQKRICRKAKMLWVPDPDQKKELSDFNVSVLPNIPIIRKSEAAIIPSVDEENRRNTLLFIGYLAHEPNYVAVDWFLKNYWASLKKTFPSLRYRIAGGGLSDKHKTEWAAFDGVELVGPVQDLASFYSSGCALLAPMRIGSGTCIKVLEALARSKPVVATPQGLRGIPQEDRLPENGIYEFSDMEDLSAAISRIVRDSVSGCAVVGSAYIEKRYSQAVVNKILASYLNGRGVS